MSKIKCTTAVIQVATITYDVDLSAYTVAQLKAMYMEGVISRNEMNDELDERAERMALMTERAG